MNSMTVIPFREKFIWRARLRQYIARREAQERCKRLIFCKPAARISGRAMRPYLAGAFMGVLLAVFVVASSGLRYTQADMEAVQIETEQRTINKIYDQCFKDGRWDIGTTQVMCLASTD